MVLSLSQENLLRSVGNNIAAHFYLHRHNLNTSLLQTVHFPRVPYKIHLDSVQKRTVHEAGLTIYRYERL